MLPLHEDALAGSLASGREVLVLDDRSLGAVVIARAQAGPVVAMIAAKTSSASEPPFWSFPKGHPDDSEDDVTAAVREVREEIGIDVADYVKPDIFDEQNYTFTSRMHTDRWKKHPSFPDDTQRPFVVYHKLVRYYLAVLPAPITLKPQEAEVAAAEWVPLDEAIARMPRADMREPFSRFFASAAVRKCLL